MITDESEERCVIRRRRITGLLSFSCAAQHGIISTCLLLLFLSSAIHSVGAQSPTRPRPEEQYPIARFTPSMAIIIAVLVAALFFMGFFSIYIRQCSDASGAAGTGRPFGASMRARRAVAARGLDAEVIETFPTFVYSDVKGLKIGKGALECAVCLCEFEDDETLRLIPKCDHVFHPECIDEWLSSHVTCPVCRTDLAPQPDETVELPDPIAAPEIPTGTSQDDAVSVRISDDHVFVDVQEEPAQGGAVVDRNQSFNRSRPPRSGSVRPSWLGKFPRSHSTGHSLVQPGENTDRFTLRLPVDVRKQVMTRALNRTTSCLVTTLPMEASSRQGFRTGRGEGSNRGGRSYRQLDRLEVKSDRWVFSMTRPFFSRASSMKSPKMDGEGSSSTTPKVFKAAVKLPSFKCLDPKIDETGLLPAESSKPAV